MTDYKPRVVDDLLARYLGAAPAVNVTGARATGKTTTALQVSSSHVFLDADQPELVDAATLNPSAILAGHSPRLLDEW